ncbi:MAG: hypothetical protein ACI83O_000460 [Patescibacteria group bacterium]|jgi:hypothetical protein
MGISAGLFVRDKRGQLGAVMTMFWTTVVVVAVLIIFFVGSFVIDSFTAKEDVEKIVDLGIDSYMNDFKELHVVSYSNYVKEKVDGGNVNVAS